MSYCSRSRRRRFTLLYFKSCAYSHIYGHFQQHLYCACAETVIMNFRCKFRHRRSIRRPRFPIRVQNFSDLATFSVVFFLFVCWMSAIFLLLVWLTYWPRKYITRVEPHVDYSCQVWSWYDHTLPSYSVFVCQHVTWPCDLDLWPFDLVQLSYMADHVTKLATKLEDPVPIRSWFMRYNVSHW